MKSSMTQASHRGMINNYARFHVTLEKQHLDKAIKAFEGLEVIK
ncbi:hypothetical protein [Algoriphagus persicinus]|nr:hypothetical protein [Algoriphagus sp. E1-3-M2]MEB2787046.1 hypothetical protein [Algoriphagus sp. E1-3-M2]